MNAPEDFASILGNIEPQVRSFFAKHLPDADSFLDDLPAMLELVTKFRTMPTDADTRSLAISFFREAERDIKSLKLLESKKIYPHAVYHFQQAVEKAAKGYVLAFGYLSKDELMKTHDTPRIFLKVFIERTGLKAFAEHTGSEALRRRITDAYDAMDDTVKRKKIAREEYRNVCEALSRIDGYGHISEQIPNLMQGITQQLESPSGIIVPQLPLVFQTILAFVTLFILAAISFPHEGYTRYPDMAIKPEEYTTDLGIVRALPKMAKMLEKENRELMELISQSS